MPRKTSTVTDRRYLRIIPIGQAGAPYRLAGCCMVNKLVSRAPFICVIIILETRNWANPALIPAPLKRQQLLSSLLGQFFY